VYYIAKRVENHGIAPSMCDFANFGKPHLPAWFWERSWVCAIERTRFFLFCAPQSFTCISSRGTRRWSAAEEDRGVVRTRRRRDCWSRCNYAEGDHRACADRVRVWHLARRSGPRWSRQETGSCGTKWWLQVSGNYEKFLIAPTSTALRTNLRQHGTPEWIFQLSETLHHIEILYSHRIKRFKD